jgi:hypothetical protein
MRKSWPFALAVIVVGGLAGVAIAGRPVPADPFVLDPSVTVPVVGSTVPTTVTTTAAATAAATTTTTIATTTTRSPTVVAASTTSTTSAPTTTESVATTTTIAGPLPRNQVRLVVANGDGRFRLASITGDRIAPLGYILDLGDALRKVGATVIYFRPGFDDEAAIIAKDITVPNALIVPLPANSSPITNSDDRGDVIVVLGPDAPR